MIDFLPNWLILALSSPYMAGRTVEQALAQAHKIYNKHKFSSTIDILGEDSRNDEICENNVSNYQQLIDQVYAQPLPVNNSRHQITISMKPSMFSMMVPCAGIGSRKALDDAFDRISRVVEYASKFGINMTLEAEDHRWTNFQLETYFALINAGYTNIGTVLQTRLLRTKNDIKRFDQRMRVRLVLGIYNEPVKIAYTDKKTMKQLLVEDACELLKSGTYVEFASHDLFWIKQFFCQVVIPHHILPSNFEVQFLQGVPRRLLQRSLTDGTYFKQLKNEVPDFHLEFLEYLQKEGTLVRMYLPFGTAEVSIAYCKRRLMNNPNLITYGISNLLGIQQ